MYGPSRLIIFLCSLSNLLSIHGVVFVFSNFISACKHWVVSLLPELLHDLPHVLYDDLRIPGSAATAHIAVCIKAVATTHVSGGDRAAGEAAGLMAQERFA